MHRPDWITSLIVTALVAGGVVTLMMARDDTADLRAELSEAVGTITVLANEVETLGGDPEEVIDRAIPGPSGPVGPEGARGERGRDGRDGRDGLDGVDGQSPPCLTLPSLCIGPQGEPGSDGVDGATPACFFTPEQCQGSPGADGADSTVPGPQGPSGPPGPSCPDGYEQAALDAGPFEGWLACRPIG